MSDDVMAALLERIENEMIGEDGELIPFLSRNEVLLLYLIGLTGTNAENADS